MDDSADARPIPEATLRRGEYSSLAGVSCPSKNACVAVGASDGATLVETWHGAAWTLPSTPNPIAAQDSSLWGVSCVSGQGVRGGGKLGQLDPGGSLGRDSVDARGPSDPGASRHAGQFAHRGVVHIAAGVHRGRELRRKLAGSATSRATPLIDAFAGLP